MHALWYLCSPRSIIQYRTYFVIIFELIFCAKKKTTKQKQPYQPKQAAYI